MLLLVSVDIEQLLFHSPIWNLNILSLRTDYKNSTDVPGGCSIPIAHVLTTTAQINTRSFVRRTGFEER